MRLFRAHARGFTLIELMLVVAIIGLLATIAIPKFANLIIKAKEAHVKGQLGAVRGALSIYYSDTEGAPLGLFQYLGNLAPKYIEEIPEIRIPTVNTSVHAPSSVTNFGPPDDFGWTINFCSWSYVPPSSVFVNCTHRDSSGRTWSQW